MNKTARLLKGIGIKLSLLSLFFTTTAQATTVSYDLVGNMKAPLTWFNDAFQLSAYYPAGGYFHMDINQGDLVFTYDDRGTASVADDFATITGTSTGCIGNQAGSNCQSQFKDRNLVWGSYQGSGEFKWDLMMQNPIARLTTGGEEFAFGQQQAGTIRLIDGAANVPKKIDVMLKNDKAYAFKLLPDLNGDGIFDAEGWFAMTGGILGASGVRGELGPNNSLLNWDFKLIRHGDTPQPPPTGEVPEPASALLLGSALLMIKKRKSSSKLP